MVKWPEDTAEPTKYWLSTMPAETSIEDLVETAKLRWRIERDYQDAKQDLGLGHYEGVRMARLPPPCQPLHRRLRTPDHPSRADSPLGFSPHHEQPDTSPFRRSTTPPIHRFAPSGTCRTPSRPCADASPSLWSSAWSDVHAAISKTHPGICVCDAVKLTGC